MPRLTVLAAALLLVVSPTMAERLVVGDGDVELEVRLLESDQSRTVLEIEIGSFESSPVTIDGETWHSLALGGESNLMLAGMPDLPDVRRSIVVPDDARMAVTVLESEYDEIAGIAVAPSKGHLLRTVDPAAVPYEFGDAYERDEWFPGELATIGEPFILRDFRGVVEKINPFQYNPATRTLRVYTRMVVELTAVGPGEVNVLTRHHRDEMNAEFYKIYEDRFINFQSGLYTSVGEMGEMLIITYDAFHDAVQPLADWKNQMGLKTTIVDVSTIPNTSSAINTYIENYYNSNNLAYVLLVGDAAQIAYPTSAGGAADPTYSLISADHYPDLFVGRMSATSVAHVQTQVDRTITYERDPGAGGAWYHKGMGIASNQGTGDDGEYDNEHMDNIRTDLIRSSYTEVDRIYDPSANAAMVTSGLNIGRSVINYTGHGSVSAWSSSGFSSTHVNALVNDNMLPFIVSVACVNGQFTSGTCFAEAWLRATNGSNPTGAIATYMSSINQSWSSPMCAQDEVVDLLVAGEKRTFGGLCYNGSCQMMDEYGADGRNMFDTWHIFGDPSVRVRTDSPVALTVSHDAAIEEGATFFTVEVTGVEGALCGLSAGGLFHGSAFTDGGGTAVIPVEGTLPTDEDVVLTVTAVDAIPYTAVIPMAPAIDPALSSSQCNDFLTLAPNGGGAVPLVVDVWVKNGSGDPVTGIPAGDVVIEAAGVSSLGKEIYFCGSGTGSAQYFSDTATDASGFTTFQISEVGGCGTIALTVRVQGVELDYHPVVNVRSPDFNGDGQVRFGDTFLYLPELLAGTGQCGNLDWDANDYVNFTDTVKYLSFLAVHAECP